MATIGRRATPSATIDVVSGASTVDVVSANLPGALVRASTPNGSGQTPRLASTATGVVDLSLVSGAAGTGGPSAVDIALDRSVSWTIELDGGATAERIDMRGGRVARVDLAAGVTRASVVLPARSGTQVVAEAGGASELTVSVPRVVATRVVASGGASTVRIGDVTHSGVAGGSTFVDPRYANAAARLDLELHGGVSSVDVRLR